MPVLQKMLNARYNKPIWLTEFATSGDVLSAASGKVASQVQLMSELLPWLDANQAVVPRYAWFQAHPPLPASLASRAHIGAKSAAKLSNAATWPLVAGDGQLTELGQYYNGAAPRHPTKTGAAATAETTMDTAAGGAHENALQDGSEALGVERKQKKLVQAGLQKHNHVKMHQHQQRQPHEEKRPIARGGSTQEFSEKGGQPLQRDRRHDDSVHTALHVDGMARSGRADESTRS